MHDCMFHCTRYTCNLHHHRIHLCCAHMACVLLANVSVELSLQFSGTGSSLSTPSLKEFSYAPQPKMPNTSATPEYEVEEHGEDRYDYGDLCDFLLEEEEEDQIVSSPEEISLLPYPNQKSTLAWTADHNVSSSPPKQKPFLKPKRSLEEMLEGTRSVPLPAFGSSKQSAVLPSTQAANVVSKPQTKHATLPKQTMSTATPTREADYHQSRKTEM